MTNKAKPPATRDSRSLDISSTPDETRGQSTARAIAGPTLGSAIAAYGYATGTMGDVDLTELAKIITKEARAAADGNSSHGEMMLASQAAALNLIFCDMARRAADNRGDYPLAFDRYIKIALKAQAQCRTTLETLAAIKNPPVVYARQANVAAGPQQVNNYAADTAHAHARGQKNGNAPNELLEGKSGGA